MEGARDTQSSLDEDRVERARHEKRFMEELKSTRGAMGVGFGSQKLTTGKRQGLHREVKVEAGAANQCAATVESETLKGPVTSRSCVGR